MYIELQLKNVPTTQKEIERRYICFHNGDKKIGEVSERLKELQEKS